MSETTKTQRHKGTEVRKRNGVGRALLCLCVSVSLWFLTHVTVSAKPGAQDERAQYPRLLSNSYVGLHAGYIDYAFSNSQLAPGFAAQSIRIPHLSVRALLLGHEFNKYFSGQVSYLRPFEWVRYENVNADHSSHSVWMNVAGLTAKAQ